MQSQSFHLPDPRAFPLYEPSAQGHSGTANPLIDAALASLATEVGAIQQQHERELIALMVTALQTANVAPIADALARAPSLAVQRLLARLLAEAQVEAGRSKVDSDLPTTVFAIPLVIVAANPTPINIPGALPNVAAITDTMKVNGALRGNERFVLSNALMSSASLALEQLPATLDWWQLMPGQPIAIPKASMPVPANQESVYLRFLVGTTLAGPGVDLLNERDTGKWGMPFTQQFAQQLGGGNLSLLALPRPPRAPLAALYQGLAAQREVSMQLFVTNAIRKFRSSYGDPEAVISVHRTANGGEVRLSLSHTFDEKGAEGFRAELFSTDRAQEVARSMQALLAECQVESVTVLGDVFPDADAETQLPLLFRADALELAADRALKLH